MNYGLSEEEIFVNVVVAVLHQKDSCTLDAVRRNTMKLPVFNFSATPAMQVHQRHVLKQIRDCDEMIRQKRELTDGERRKKMIFMVNFPSQFLCMNFPVKCEANSLRRLILTLTCFLPASRVLLLQVDFNFSSFSSFSASWKSKHPELASNCFLNKKILINHEALKQIKP